MLHSKCLLAVERTFFLYIKKLNSTLPVGSLARDAVAREGRGGEKMEAGECIGLTSSLCKGEERENEGRKKKSYPLQL